MTSSNKIKLFGYKKCSTCRKAEKALSELGLEYTYTDITENPPSASALKKYAQSAELEPKKLFNTSGVLYREMSIKDKLPEMKSAEIFSLLAKHGKLIKRPIITDGDRVTVGFKEDVFMQTWDA